MRKFYFVLISMFFITIANAQQAFITSWEIPDGDQTVMIPVVVTPGISYTIDFGDGTILTAQTGPVSHTYNIAGNYNIAISGNIHQITFSQGEFWESRLQAITQWGDIQWTSMANAFAQCNNLTVTATDTPNLSQVTDMSYMFRYTAINQSINNWDVSTITNMEGLFNETIFNQPLDNWSVANVINMKDMFRGASQFNQPLDSWNVGNVTNMEGMFTDAHLFSQPLNSWDVSNVVNMKEMFRETPFNQPLNNWDVSNVVNMLQMFSNAWAFNQPLNNWDVSNVTNMQQMFHTANDFNQPLGDWDVSNVQNMQEMFKELFLFNQPLNSWDVSNVNNMRGMFSWTLAFDQPLDAWDVSSVTNMDEMFTNSAFSQPINNWDVSNVTSMVVMFYQNDYFNQPLDNWDVSNVTNMGGMFATAGFNQPLASWDVSSVTNFRQMFKDNESFNQPLDSWDVSNATDMHEMFSGSIYNHPLNSWDVSNVTTMQRMLAYHPTFNQPLDNWDVSTVTTMSGMFRNTTLFNQPIENWNVSNVTDMTSMFNLAAAFNQPLDNWDVSGVLEMRSMFRDAESFNQNLGAWEFNNEVDLGTASAWGFDPGYFVSYSGMDSQNYDALLLRFAQLELQNKYMRANEMQYCNSGVRNHLINNLGWTIIGDAQGDECSTNTIMGNVIYDENANGCTTDDVKGVNLMLSASTTEFDYVTFTGTQGEYAIEAMDQSYTVGLINLPSYFNAAPNSSTVTFTGSGMSEEVNFCLTSSQSVTDLNIVILPISEARPGFDAQYKMVVENIGTQSVSGASVVFSYDDQKQTFVESLPASTTNSDGVLTFILGDVAPLSTRIIDITMNTFAPPIVNGGDFLDFTASVLPVANDVTASDNVFELAQEVINSYDPNDKTVLQGEEVLIEDADQYLHYVIRFQNTGSASAINVRIDDVLHQKLDWTTLRPISSSHDYQVVMTNGNELSFVFDDINLPHEAMDSVGSNGYIAYKIKPVQNIAIGDLITGNASIYFDYNLPIITNTVSTEIIQTLKTGSFDLSSMISIYPNPTGGIVNIKLDPSIEVENITLTNLQGRELFVLAPTTAVSLETLSAGIYILSVKTKMGIITKKLVKY